MTADTRRFAAHMAPTVVLTVVVVVLGVVGFPTVAAIVAAPILPAWAIGLGRALFLSANRPLA